MRINTTVIHQWRIGGDAMERFFTRGLWFPLRKHFLVFVCSLLVYYFALYIAFEYVSNGNWLITYWDELLDRIKRG